MTEAPTMQHGECRSTTKHVRAASFAREKDSVAKRGTLTITRPERSPNQAITFLSLRGSGNLLTALGSLIIRRAKVRPLQGP